MQSTLGVLIDSLDNNFQFGILRATNLVFCCERRLRGQTRRHVGDFFSNRNATPLTAPYFWITWYGTWASPLVPGTVFVRKITTGTKLVYFVTFHFSSISSL